MSIKLTKLKDMELMARGNPQKIADFKRAEAEYKETVDLLFTDDAPVGFTDIPNESQVLNAEQIALTSGDTADIARASILRDRFEHYEADKTKHLDWRITKRDLTRKISEGEKLTQRDVIAAERLARANNSTQNLALYSQIKQTFEEPSA